MHTQEERQDAALNALERQWTESAAALYAACATPL